MSGRESNWKKHLLRTSVPLEHEAARLLDSCGFGVSSDYSYYRLDAGIEKEFSVDVRGVKGFGSEKLLAEVCLLDVLVECKYRDRDTTWVFLPEPRYSSGHLHDGVEFVDLFSCKFVRNAREHSDPAATICYAAVEVGVAVEGDEKARGRAVESQLRHGARQLQYAIPSLIMLRTRTAALLPPEESRPFFYSQILLTNARLLVAEPTFGIATVERAGSLADIGTEVPYVIWTVEPGPDFYHHCQRQFAGLAQLATTPSMRTIEEFRKGARDASWTLPSELARRIAIDPADSIHLATFKNIIVVNIAHLAQVLEFIDRTFIRMSTSMKDEPIVKW